MKKYTRLASILGIIIALAAIALAAWFIGGHNLAVLNPKGEIAEKQQQLIIYSTVLMSLVVIPVFLLTFGIAWRYRASNKKATYSPELAGNRWAELVWWLIPTIIIGALSVVAWKSSHDLDPYKPLVSDKKPLKVQVIALQWKWLFIYPEQNIASVNYLAIPTDTPIDFTITADAPMNSFWIPQLGGQVYAMSGMSTQLHLIANEAGDYRGSSANISGEGFADMTFTTHATSSHDFAAWVQSAAASPEKLTQATYAELAKPSKATKITNYAAPDETLYDTVVAKYMSHGEGH